MFDVGCDTDDLTIRVVLAVTRKVMSERFFVGKLLARESFVNHGDPRAVLRVLHGEEPAFDQANAHRLQVIGTRDVKHRLRLFAGFGLWTSDDGERSVGGSRPHQIERKVL